MRPYRARLRHRAPLSAASTVFMIIGPKIMGQTATKLFEGVMSQIAGSVPASISPTSVPIIRS